MIVFLNIRIIYSFFLSAYKDYLEFNIKFLNLIKTGLLYFIVN